jgi:hypothetical protein
MLDWSAAGQVVIAVTEEMSFFAERAVTQQLLSGSLAGCSGERQAQ